MPCLAFYYKLRNKKTKKNWFWRFRCDMSLTKYISEKQKDKGHLPCLAFYYKLKNKKKKKNWCWRIRIYVRKNHAENKKQMRWGVEVIGWLNLCFFCLQHACKNLCTFFAFFFFLFTVCTSIIFFFRIKRIYVLSLLFLVYRVHINHFFSSIL